MSTLSCWRDIGIQGDRSCPELKQLVHCRNCDRYIQGARSLFERPLTEEMLSSVITPSPLPHARSSIAASLNSEEDAVRNAMAIFRLGREWFSLPAGIFQRVISPTPIRPIPYRSDALLQGFINVRGELLLCIDLSALLNLPLVSAIADGGRFAIVKQEQQSWAFPVDEFQGIELVARSLFFAPPVSLRKATQTHTQNLFIWNQQSVNVLDETALFNALSQKVTP